MAKDEVFPVLYTLIIKYDSCDIFILCLGLFSAFLFAVLTVNE